MAGYDADWEDRQGGWRGGRAGRGRASGSPRGGRARGQQPWASRRPGRWSGSTGSGYGSEYRSRGAPSSDFGPGSQREFGPGYDFGYQGGEWGYPTNAQRFGTGGPHASPEHRIGGNRRRSGGWRTDAYNAAYGRDFMYEGGRGGAPWLYRSGRGQAYDADFGAVNAGRGWSAGFYGADYERAAPDEASGRMGNADLRGRPARHYGHTPVDRWPAPQAARSERAMDDNDVRESVRENLFQDSFVNPDRIDVQVDRGVVTLRGEVDDFLQTRYAWDDAWESPGVRGVINNLTVRSDRAGDES